MYLSCSIVVSQNDNDYQSLYKILTAAVNGKGTTGCYISYNKRERDCMCACHLEGVNFGKFWRFFHCSQKLNPPFSFTVCTLNGTCLPIRQVKIRQPQKISNLPNFNPSKYTHYTVDM